MSQPESKLSRKIMEQLRLQGWFCFKVHGSEHMMAGLPDIMVCAEGQFIGLETKMPQSRDNVSPVQRLVHSKINNAGGTAAVVCSPQEAIDVVNGVLAAR